MGKQVSVYLSEGIIDVIKKIADKNGRSFSFIINSLLIDVLKRRKNGR